MLLAADVSLADPMLPTLFRVGRVANSTFSLLEKTIRPDAQPQPSSQLLIDIASRSSQFASWSNVCTVPRELLVLVNVDKKHRTRRKFKFRCQDCVFKLELPSVNLEPVIGKITPGHCKIWDYLCCSCPKQACAQIVSSIHMLSGVIST